MSKLKCLLATAVAAIALVVTADAAPTSYRWHFNGADGVAAPSSVADASGTYTLELSQFGSGTLTDQMSQSDALGGLMYWSQDGKMAYDADVAGSVQLFRRDNATGTPGKYHASRYRIPETSGAAKQLFPVNASGELESFTVEMVFKAQPFDEAALGLSAHNFFLLSLNRYATGGNYNLFDICEISSRQLYVMCSGDASNSMLSWAAISNESDYRDGQWHHLAAVYTLDTTKTPHKGTVEIFLDYVSKGSRDLNNKNGVQALRHLNSDGSFEYDCGFTVGEMSSAQAADLAIDEVRVTQAALTSDEFFRAGHDGVAFFCPLSVHGDVAKNVGGDVLSLTAVNATQRIVNPTLALTDGDGSYSCGCTTVLAGDGSLSLISSTFGSTAQTFETSFRTSDSGSQTLWAQGAAWSMTLDGGTLTWHHGAANETVATGLADGAWHSLALVYEPGASSAAYTASVDGVAKTLADTTPLSSGGDLIVVGAGFTGELLGLRLSQEARAAARLLHVEETNEAASFWWHFNGSDGERAPAFVRTTDGGWAMGLKQNSAETATTRQETQSDCMGTVAYWQSADGEVRTDSDVAGAVQVHRYRTDVTPGTCLSSYYSLPTADEAKAIFPTNAVGDLRDFTIEWVFNVAPYDADICGSAKNFFLGSIMRSVSSSSSAVLNICGISNGNIYLQGTSHQGTNADIINAPVLNEADFRDGRWHHVAVVYTLDEAKSPAQGTCKVYLDHVLKKTQNLNKVGGRASFRYLNADGTAESNAGFAVGDIGNGKAEIAFDEVRVTQKALTTDEMLRLATPERVEGFYFPLGQGGNLVRNLGGTAALAAAGATEKIFTPAATLADADGAAPCAVSTALAGDGSLSVGAGDLLGVGLSPFTLELSFRTSASGKQTLLSHGLWSLTLADGTLAWAHGAASETVATGLADGTWHSVALVYDPASATPYTVFADGTGHALADAVKLPTVMPYPLVIGDAFTGSLVGLRLTPAAKTSGGLLRVVEAADGETLAYWPMTTLEDSGTKIQTVSEGTGNASLTLTSGLTSGGTIRATDENRPVWSNDVPAAVLVANGKIVNADNRTSVYFHNTGYFDDATQQWINGGAGGCLLSKAYANFGESFTVELFVKPLHRFSQYMTTIVEDNYSGGCYWNFDAQNSVSASVKIRVPTDASDPNRHAQNMTAMNVGAWNHVAITFEKKGDGTFDVRQYVNHKAAGKSLGLGSCYDVTKAATLSLSNTGGQPLEGLVDELRVTRGVLPIESFMRVFELRTDLTGVWLMDGATGVEHFNGGALGYLDGMLAAGATASDDLPIADPVFRVKGRGLVHPTSSVSLDGTGGLVLPCLAVAGADDFTVEATVCGTGTVAAKKRTGGVSWSFGIGADGRPTMRFDTGLLDEGNLGPTVEAAAADVIDTTTWHHVALVCNRTTKTATLYVDRTAVATADVSGIVIDEGDLVWGGDFAGKMMAARFAPKALTTDEFLVAEERKGSILIVR